MKIRGIGSGRVAHTIPPKMLELWFAVLKHSPCIAEEKIGLVNRADSPGISPDRIIPYNRGCMTGSKIPD